MADILPAWVKPLLACPVCRRSYPEAIDEQWNCACGKRFVLTPVARFADGCTDAEHGFDRNELARRMARQRSAPWIGDRMIASLPSGATVLSVGEGYGELVLRLAQDRPDVHFVASDLSLVRSQWASAARDERGLANLWMCVADVRQLPFTDGAFDTAYARGLLHVVPQPLDAVSELRRVVTTRLLVDQLPNDPWGIVWFWLLQQWENIRARVRGRAPDTRIFGELRATRKRGGTFRPLFGYRGWFRGARRRRLCASSLFVWETGQHHPVLGWLGSSGAIDVWF
jgi:SAM-dependent methyltransferase